MKKTRILSRLLVFALAISLLMTACLTAAAASSNRGEEPPYQITIRNNEGLPGMVAEQFAAYQLFGGRRVELESEDKVEENGQSWNKYSLADIVWGDNVDGAKLLAALKGEEVPDAFKVEGVNIFVGVNSAADVAEVLEGHRDNAFLQEFSKFVASKDADGAYLYLKDEPAPAKSKVTNPDAAAKDQTSEITVDKVGYYLILEDKVPSIGDHENEVRSEFILAVLGDQEITIKADVPTLEKKIVKGEDLVDYDALGIGDVVTFRLTATLPQDFADYEWYYYIFNDTLSKGLTLNETFKVQIDGKDVAMGTVSSANWDPTANEGAGAPKEGSFPLFTKGSGSEGETPFTIDMGDLLKGYKDAGFEITANSKITVEYTATLNSDAIIGDDGNINTADLTYSNDPNQQNSKGKTPPDEVKVYTFNLVLTKVTEGEPSTPLANAQFYLTKVVGEDTYYYSVTKAEGKDVYGWVKQESSDKIPDNATLLVTDSQGKFTEKVNGLDADVEYTLHEYKAPDGYNSIPDIKFTIKATIDDTGLTAVTVSSEATGVAWTTNVKTADAIINGAIAVKVEDPKAPILPVTGGTGTALYVLAGAVLTVLAAACLFVLPKKNNG